MVVRERDHGHLGAQRLQVRIQAVQAVAAAVVVQRDNFGRRVGDERARFDIGIRVRQILVLVDVVAHVAPEVEVVHLGEHVVHVEVAKAPVGARHHGVVDAVGHRGVDGAERANRRGVRHVLVSCGEAVVHRGAGGRGAVVDIQLDSPVAGAVGRVRARGHRAGARSRRANPPADGDLDSVIGGVAVHVAGVGRVCRSLGGLVARGLEARPQDDLSGQRIAGGDARRKARRIADEGVARAPRPVGRHRQPVGGVDARRLAQHAAVAAPLVARAGPGSGNAGAVHRIDGLQQGAPKRGSIAHQRQQAQRQGGAAHHGPVKHSRAGASGGVRTAAQRQGTTKPRSAILFCGLFHAAGPTAKPHAP